MNFNNFVFPKPSFNFKIVKDYKDELIYIPSKAKDNHYIPCLLFRDPYKISKNFVIFFHGNAEDIFLSRSMGYPLCQKTGMNVLIVEYPGYSIYKGDADANIILQNTGIVYDFIKNLFNLEDKNIFIFGRSIGSSPAIYLASIRKPKALFVVSSFTSIRAVADNLVGILKYLLKERFTSIDYIKQVSCPVLFIHGKSDPLINYKETLLVREKCVSYSEVSLVDKMTHNDFDLYEDIIDPIYEFIQKNCEVDKDKNDFKSIKSEIDKIYVTPKEIREFIDYNLKK